MTRVRTGERKTEKRDAFRLGGPGVLVCNKALKKIIFGNSIYL
jgi:hypothetical protein